MMWIIIGTGVAACIVSLALTALSIRLSYRLRLLDQPEARKVHQAATPRLGGIGIIVASFLVGIPAFLYLNSLAPDSAWLEGKRYLAVAVGALFVFVMGVADDLWGVSSRLKLLTLLAASSVFCASGAGLESLVYDFEAAISFPWLSWILTAAWITGMAVAFNFIDGLDGLSGGIALIASVVLAYFQLSNGNFAAAVAPLVLSGALVGFLYFNWHPAKTFMGDGGSLTIGYLLGTMTLVANTNANLGSMRAIIVPSLAMSVPIVDAGLTMFRRRYEQRRSMFSAERGHIHHRLLDRGFKHHQVVLLIHGVSILAVAIGFFSLQFQGWSTLGGLALVVPVLWALFHAAGSMRTNEMVTAIRRKRSIDRTSRGFRSSFELLQLEFDGSRDFSQWWKTVCHAAERLHFAQIELPIESAVDHEKRTFRWINEVEDFHDETQRIDAKIPIPLFGSIGQSASAEIRVPIAASLESAGERIALFSRLMAENGYEAMRRINSLEQRKQRQRAADETLDPGEFGHLRVAIVHDTYTTYDEAEHVVQQLICLFPHADLFALTDFLPDDQRGFLCGKPVQTTFLQRLPFSRSKPRLFLPLVPLAIEQFDLSSYDLVISSSHLAAKGVLTGPDQLHLSYCHTPARAGSQQRHLHEAGYGPKGLFARTVLHYLRNWDARASLGVDHFVANSHAVARHVEKRYRRGVEVIAPPVDTDLFAPADDDQRESTYVAIGPLTPDSRFDLVIEAFNQTPKRRLTIIGEGPEQAQLERLAGANITLLPYQSREVVARHLQRAQAFLHVAGDDFTTRPIEALACGTPVVACHASSAAQIIKPGKVAHYFAELTTESLLGTLDAFEQQTPLDDLDRKVARQAALHYAIHHFHERFTDCVHRELEAHKSPSPDRSPTHAAQSSRQPDPASQPDPESASPSPEPSESAARIEPINK